MIVSRGQRSDTQALARVMFQAVRQGATQYTVLQRHAWMPRLRDTQRFAQRLAAMEVLVTRSYHGPVVDRASYIDLAFVLPRAQGLGVFRSILSRIARPKLSTHASLHAAPAFSAFGFTVVRHEVIKRRGTSMRRAFMVRDGAHLPKALSN